MTHWNEVPRMGLLLATAALTLAGCAQVKEKPALAAIQQELRQATEPPRGRPLPAAVEAALAPQTQVRLPKAAAQPLEPRFDLAVNNAPAQQVFLGIASGTRYSMLLHPEVAGNLTLNLKDVTVPEAMAAIRELYGYDYRSDGSRIFVQPLTLQTRFYSIPYPAGVRQGRSELRVISGSISDTGKNGGGDNTSGGGASAQLDSSRIVTSVNTDFWGELQASVGMMVGCMPGAASTPGNGTALSCPEGRNVVVSPHTSMLSVRALPAEQRQIESYLKAAKLQVERQVMIEAKIVEVTLNEGAQSGINWAYFHKGLHRASKGASGAELPVDNPSAVVSSDLAALLGTGLPANAAASASSAGVFGLAFQTANFAALLNFLETQGGVQVLSSPRISALNNQQAVLKVGTDEFFVTGITSNTSTSGTSTTSSPTLTVQPFFSGIALDVTPQIDDQDHIILHVHPSVSQVTSNDKSIDLGTLGTYNLPLAASTVSEADSIVRLKDGEIAAIGGLMKRESLDSDSAVPGLSDVPLLGRLFKNSNSTRRKHELVILLKPTLIKQSSDWLEGAQEAEARLGSFAAPSPHAGRE